MRTGQQNIKCDCIWFVFSGQNQRLVAAIGDDAFEAIFASGIEQNARESRVVFNDLNDVERVRVFERGVSAGDSAADSYGEFKLLVRDGDIVSPKVEPSEPLKNQCADFVASIAGGRPPLVTGRFGTSVVRTLVAIEASMRSRGAAVEV